MDNSNETTSHKRGFSSSTSADVGVVPPLSSRRAFATLVGALGAIGLTNCTNGQGERATADALPDEDLEALQLALVGNGTLKIADTAANLRTIGGGSATWVAVLQGLVSVGDGGGGVFYWSTIAKADDGWSTLNLSAGNVAGWRRVHPGVLAVSTVSALRTMTGGASPGMAILAGYATAGDGGGGLFYWSTSPAADDGGTVINSGGGTSAGWRRIYTGALKPRWFGILNDATPADNARLDAFLSKLHNGEINVQDFGILPDGSDCRAKFQNLIDRESPVLGYGHQGFHTYYFPAGYYEFASTINVPNAEKRLRIRGDGYKGAGEVYGHPLWSTIGRIGGTCLYFRPNTDGFTMSISSPSTVPGHLDLVDLAIVATGSGAGVRQTSLVPDVACGAVRCHNVYVGGAAIGLKLLSYSASSFTDLCVHGCNVGLQIGDIDGTGNGFGPAAFRNLEVQFCNIGIDWQNASKVSIYGGLLQGNLIHHNFKSGCYRGAAVYETYSENGRLIACEPGVIHGSFRMYACSAGDSPALELYGNSWGFHATSLPPVHFPTQVFGVRFVHCDCQITSVFGSDIQQSNTNQTIAAYPRSLGSVPPGVVQIDAQNGGSLQECTVSGNTTFALPDAAPRGMQLFLLIIQNAAGGHSVSVSGRVSPIINLTGNIANTRTLLHFIYADLFWTQVSPNVWR